MSTENKKNRMDGEQRKTGVEEFTPISIGTAFCSTLVSIFKIMQCNTSKGCLDAPSQLFY